MGSPFKMNPKTPFMKALVGKQGNLPQHLQDAIKAAPAKKTTDPKKKKDDFRYESDMPEVIGTAYTKDGTERVTEYIKGGKTMKKGDTYERGGFQTPKKVVDTGRDASGRKKAGRTGTVDVEVKKGDIRFSTGKKTKKKTGSGKSPAKSYGKSPVKKTTQAMKNIRSKTTTSSGEKRMSNTPSKDRRKVYTKGSSSPSEVSYIKKEKSVSAIKPRGPKTAKLTADKKVKSKSKSPAKMVGGKKGRPGTGVRKGPKPLTPSQKANVNAQNKRANANAKRTGRGTGLIKDPRNRTKKKK